jgi:hypothetical protein
MMLRKQMFAAWLGRLSVWRSEAIADFRHERNGWAISSGIVVVLLTQGSQTGLIKDWAGRNIMLNAMRILFALFAKVKRALL